MIMAIPSTNVTMTGREVIPNVLTLLNANNIKKAESRINYRNFIKNNVFCFVLFSTKKKPKIKATAAIAETR